MIQWRPIRGFPDYQVSSNGQVKRVTGGVKGAKKGRILRGGMVNGCPTVCLRKNGRSYWLLVSRLVLRTFVGPPPTRQHEAAHEDGDSTRNLLGNLRWATRAENEGDKVGHGRTNRGERHGMSKLTERQVIRIRRQWRPGLTIALAARYGVCRECVRDIVNGKRWRHLL